MRIECLRRQRYSDAELRLLHHFRAAESPSRRACRRAHASAARRHADGHSHRRFAAARTLRRARPISLQRFTDAQHRLFRQPGITAVHAPAASGALLPQRTRTCDCRFHASSQHEMPPACALRFRSPFRISAAPCRHTAHAGRRHYCAMIRCWAR